MDYNDPSRRQYAQNPYSTHQQPPTTSAYTTTQASVERFRQSSYLQQQQSPTTVPSTGRAGSDQVYGFTHASQYGSAASATAQTMQYTTELQTPDVPRPQSSQQYGQYIYGLPSQTQSATQSPYDPVSRYTQRPGTASETLASQFGAAQATGYYLAGTTVPTSATMPDLAAPHLPTQYQTAYAQVGPSTQTYASAMLDSTPTSAYSVYGAQTQYTPAQGQTVDQQYTNYQAQVRTIFSHVREGSLREVGELLLSTSHYLLSNVEALGLTRDNDSVHDDRIRMWDEFNRAWLATLQAQFDLTQDYLRTHQLGESRSIMNQQTLEGLSRELVRYCDSIEKHGLVDYQMGVAEEEIMDLLLRCLSLLELENPAAAETGAESSSSATATR